MTANATYLRVITLLITASLITLTLSIASTTHIVSTTTTGASYLISVGLGILLLFLSLVIACYSFIKTLLLLDCEQWNIRMVIVPSIIQIVFICAGILIFACSLFFI